MFVQLSNKDISKILELCSKVLELLGENDFKIKSYSIAAFKINKHPIPLHTLTEAEIINSDIYNKNFGTKILEILSTGSLSYLEELVQQLPEGLIDLLQIKGLGAKKIKLLYDELGIQSIGELLYACQENRIQLLKGFGKKTQDQIIQNIQFIQSNANKYLYAEIDNLCDSLLTAYQKQFPEGTIRIAGDYARQNPIVDTIHIFSDCDFNAFTSFFQTIIIDEELEIDDTNNCLKSRLLPIIIFHTISEDSGIEMLKLNSSEDFFKEYYQHLQVTKGRYDTEILNDNNLPLIHPAQRESYNTDPKSHLESFPIKGLIHCHSNWSDGSNTILQMAEQCIQLGLEYMVISDHSVSAFYANGLSEDRIFAQHQEIDELNKKLHPFKIFKSIEADILYNGQLDYNDSIWPTFDLIIGSVHAQLKMTKEKATERILTALDNPYMTILGHPTGRLLLSRNGYELDYEAIFKKCQEKNIIIELNAHPRRLDLDHSLINQAINFGLKISINSDAHSTAGIEVLKYGILAAQKTALSAAQNVSSFSLEEFEAFLSARHK